VWRPIFCLGFPTRKKAISQAPFQVCLGNPAFDFGGFEPVISGPIRNNNSAAGERHAPSTQAVVATGIRRADVRLGDEMTDKLLNFIDGEWREPSTGKWAPNRNPADARVVLNEAPMSDAADLQLAMDGALRAQKDWARTPAPVRGKILFNAVRLFEKRTEELARALTAEEGKILEESRGEVQKMINLLEFVAGEARRLNGETIPSEIPNTFAYTVRVPIGVVASITPWNFPVAIPVWKAAPAMVAGNAVIHKPANQTPWTAKIIAEVFAEAGIPKGIYNVIYGRGSLLGSCLVNHPHIDGITFTGSTEIGLGINESAARSKKKVQCEMGGKNPVIVMEDADVALAVQAAAKGGFGATGQRCTATSRAIVHRDVYNEFLEGIVEMARTMRPGDGFDPASALGPSVDEGQMNTVLRYIDIGKSEGATLAAGGMRLMDAEREHGYFVAPTVFANVDRKMRVAREEIFGPVMSVLPISSMDEAIDVANDTPFGLSSSIYTRDVNRVFRYVDRVETGMLHVNNPTIGGEAQMPFGGMKQTGIGEREQGKTAVDFSTELKTIYIDYAGSVRGGNLF